MEVNLPSHQIPAPSSELERSGVKKSKYPSAHFVYGFAILVLAIVMTGIVLELSNVRIPYISSLYAQQVPPLPVVTTPVAHDASQAVSATSTATTTQPAATSTSGKKT
jgi:hypothetical protein